MTAALLRCERCRIPDSNEGPINYWHPCPSLRLDNQREQSLLAKTPETKATAFPAFFVVSQQIV